MYTCDEQIVFLPGIKQYIEKNSRKVSSCNQNFPSQHRSPGSPSVFSDDTNDA